MYDALTTPIHAWNKRILAAIEACLGKQGQVDVDSIAAVLSQVAAWPGCPRASTLSSASEAPSYRRIPIDTGNALNYEALLIVWPPEHATPIHDHDGLWGMEFVLDGVLEVESFQLLPQPPIHLERTRCQLVGVGDHIAFSLADYAHRCRNLSRNRQALSLHVYGGELNRYRSFAHKQGQWSCKLHHAVREKAVSP
jgi:hypothetical protein